MKMLSRQQGWELFAAQMKTLVGSISVLISVLWIPIANGFINIPQEYLPRIVPVIEGNISSGEYTILNISLAWLFYWGLVTLLDGAVAWKKITGYKEDEQSTITLPSSGQTLYQ